VGILVGQLPAGEGSRRPPRTSIPIFVAYATDIRHPATSEFALSQGRFPATRSRSIYETLSRTRQTFDTRRSGG
jgi:hypothetical protein